MGNHYEKMVIIGATSAIAEHCTRILIKDKALQLILVARNLHKMEQIAADLRVRSPQSLIEVRTTDFTDPASIRALVDGIAAEGKVDKVLIAHGTLPDQAACQEDLAAAFDALNINGVSPVLFAEAFAGHMQKANAGTLAIISSVAGDRGRKSNYIYGAAKGLIERYVQGLQHRLAGTQVKVVLIKPGPTDTPMTAHLKQQGNNLASVQTVAQLIVKGINKGKPVIYAPSQWRLIMLIIRQLPSFIFNKINI